MLHVIFLTCKQVEGQVRRDVAVSRPKFLSRSRRQAVISTSIWRAKFQSPGASRPKFWSRYRSWSEKLVSVSKDPSVQVQRETREHCSHTHRQHR